MEGCRVVAENLNPVLRLGPHHGDDGSSLMLDQHLSYKVSAHFRVVI
jgi:hypothetical protein